MVTRLVHDQFAKSLLSDFLEPWGQIQVSREVSDEPRSIDIYFEPYPDQKLGELGLLGRIVQDRCLLEPYRNPVTASQIRACLLKALTVRSQQERVETKVKPVCLWILTPTASLKSLSQFGAQPDDQWPRGVYLLPAGLSGAVVVIHQLPVERSTLRLRLLGRGRVQQQAIAEILQIEPGDPERIKVLELLGNWKILLDEKQERLREEERELMMNLSPAYLKWKEETINEGIQIGEQRGIQIGEQELTLRLLRLKVGSLSEDLETQVRGLPLHQLESLSEALLDFQYEADLREWLERHG